MRTRWLLFVPTASLAAFLASCTTDTSQNPIGGQGPFDANGRYHEEWADNPSMWKKGGQMGRNAEPTQAEVASIQSSVIGGNSGGGSMSNTTPYAKVTPVKTVPIVRPPTTIASNAKATHNSRDDDDDEEDSPRTTKGKGGKAVATTTKGKGKTAVATTTKGKGGKTAVVTNTKGKGKTAVLVKPKPATGSKYTVRKGDSLFAIAKRYGTTAGAIQKANHLSGTSVRPGQTLTVPKK